MTAAVPLIHAFSVAMVTGIMVEQAGESEGSRGKEMWQKGMEMGKRNGVEVYAGEIDLQIRYFFKKIFNF